MDIYVNILCEGPSEEHFINQIMFPYMQQRGIYVRPVILGKHGGVSHYAQIRKELKLLGRDSSSYLTTMFDYYKLPQDVPGVRECAETEPVKIGKYIEIQMEKDLQGELQCKRYIPNIIVHEYEALLFSDPSCFSKCQGISKAQLKKLKDTANQYTTPEHINNSEQTAPSKRILGIFKQYQKVIDGTIIANEIGMERMMERCPHFAEWVRELVDLVN